MALASKHDAIFFDVGNTLLFPNWDDILAPLAQRGIKPGLDQLRRIEQRTKNEFDASAMNGRVDHGFWYLFYSDLLDELGLANEHLRQALLAATHLSANWNRIRPGTRESLDTIASKYRIGVISNADGKIADVLKLSGISDCFLSITDSGIVGHEKPHPGIFNAALQSMNVQPERALYVGDVYSVDYIGATGVGMDAILFDVAGAYRDKNLPRVESLNELQRHLEGATSSTQ